MALTDVDRVDIAIGFDRLQFVMSTFADYDYESPPQKGNWSLSCEIIGWLADNVIICRLICGCEALTKEKLGCH